MYNILIGAHVSAGTFTEEKTGREIVYDNIVLQVTEPYGEMDGFHFGVQSKTIKLKNDADVLFSLFGCNLTSKDFELLEGEKFNCYYNEKKKPVMLQFLNGSAADIIK